MEKRYYVAYGSNLNLGQMAMRCPTAKVVGTGWLEDTKLTFRRVATIEPEKDKKTPVGVWEIQPMDEVHLDRYEGYPHLYRKEMVKVKMDNGDTLDAMVYIMNSGKPQMPMEGYYRTIAQGYHDCGLDIAYLEEAVEDTYLRANDK